MIEEREKVTWILHLLVVWSEVFSVPGSGHQTSIRPSELVRSGAYDGFNDVGSLPIWSENSNTDIFGSRVEFFENQVVLFESPLLDLRVEISLRSLLVASDSESGQVALFFEEIKLVSLECEVLLLIVSVAS